MSVNQITREDEIAYLCDRAIRELRKELRKRLKEGITNGAVFPVYGRAQSEYYGQVMVGIEWKP